MAFRAMVWIASFAFGVSVWTAVIVVMIRLSGRFDIAMLQSMFL